MFAQGLLAKASDRFLGIDTLLRVSDNSMDEVLEEAFALSIKLCVSDATHSNKVIETMQGFQSRSLGLLGELAEGLRKISDRASVERCKRFFNKVVAEVRNISLTVASDAVIQSDSSSVSSSVSSNSPNTTTVTTFLSMTLTEYQYHIDLIYWACSSVASKL
jgi:hypothetical protein